MKRFIDVHTGEIVAGQGEVVLKSDTESACLIIAAYDPTKKIGALAHARFANGITNHKYTSPVFRDATQAVDEMINDMSLLGSQPENIEISVVAGENVHHDANDSAYHESINEVLKVIKDRHLRFRQDLTEEIGNSHLALDVESGEVSCK